MAQQILPLSTVTAPFNGIPTTLGQDLYPTRCPFTEIEFHISFHQTPPLSRGQPPCAHREFSGSRCINSVHSQHIGSHTSETLWSRCSCNKRCGMVCLASTRRLDKQSLERVAANATAHFTAMDPGYCLLPTIPLFILLLRPQVSVLAREVWNRDASEILSLVAIITCLEVAKMVRK
ncbi:hypothetical protein HNY73_022804 [Argiope bruennichi]|uniref:Uncharacterized protein n=1 Tax=Argiope bruennichi TaxID=94029 RepID=A0A8T0E1S6_ARGBR|nr:hypothetical protein HNY73_022804 [Argiope bruennichi]